MYRRILIPLDGSEAGEVALKEGLELAHNLGAEVTLLHVLHVALSVYTMPESEVFDPRLIEKAREAAEALLEAAAAQARERGVEVKTLLLEAFSQPPAEAILDAEEAHDLTVMATHARRGLSHFFLGSVTEAVLRRSKKPHLVVHGGVSGGGQGSSGSRD
jgi:nucleotide-binding universal stress UspA family protein